MAGLIRAGLANLVMKWTYYKDGRLDQQISHRQETARLRADEAAFILRAKLSSPLCLQQNRNRPMCITLDRQSIRYSILNRGRDGLLLSTSPK